MDTMARYAIAAGTTISCSRRAHSNSDGSTTTVSGLYMYTLDGGGGDGAARGI
jgi:hypothetical protein